MQEHLPKLYHHLRSLGILTMISLPWFITCYLSAMPFQSAVHIVDCFFYDGSRVLLQVALTILSEIMPQLLDTSDDCLAMAQLNQYLQGVFSHDNLTTLKADRTINITALLQASYDRFGFISNELVIEKRQHVMLRVVQSIQDNVSNSAVRSAVDESLFDVDELAALHRVFYDGVMKVSEEQEQEEERKKKGGGGHSTLCKLAVFPLLSSSSLPRATTLPAFILCVAFKLPALIY